jgi:uncharacterized FAD-dependent dehydrogenase
LFCFIKKLKIFGKYNSSLFNQRTQIIGVESRILSPVKILRNKETFEHVTTKRLFACAEGAGYAGCIMSATMDGERCAEALMKMYVI